MEGRKEMRKLVFVVVAIGLLWFGGSWCLGQLQSGVGSMNSPLSTAKSAINSLETLEPAKIQAYCTPIPGQLMATRVSRLYQNIKSLDIQNLNAMIVVNEGSAARVQATYDMVLTSQLGVLSTEHCSKTIKLILNPTDKRWLVNEAF